MFTFDAVISLHHQLARERGPFPYLSRVLELPPLVAQAAFDVPFGAANEDDCQPPFLDILDGRECW